MEHILYKQRIKKNKLDDYLEAHDNCPAEIVIEEKKAGLERVICWIDGLDVYIYMMTDDFNKALNILNGKKIFKDWLKKMESMNDFFQDYSEGNKVKKYKKFFDLEEYLKKKNYKY